METRETEFSNRILVCIDCGEEFVFTASAQAYFNEKGFTEDPKRCRTCYMKVKRSKENRERSSGRRGSRRHEQVNYHDSRYRGNGNGNGNSHANDGLPQIPDDYE
jgi:hypothetical protein